MVFDAMVQTVSSIYKSFSDKLSNSNFGDDNTVCVTHRLDLLIFDDRIVVFQPSYSRRNLELSIANPELLLFQYSAIKTYSRLFSNILELNQN